MTAWTESTRDEDWLVHHSPELKGPFVLNQLHATLHTLIAPTIGNVPNFEEMGNVPISESLPF